MCKIETQNKFGTAIVLAGGKSSRMGFDKQFLMINKKRLLEEVISILEMEFEEIIIVTNKPDEYRNVEYKIVSDIIKEKGPLSGLHVGLKNASSIYSYFIACDMPNINIEYIRYMKKRIGLSSPKACVTKRGKCIEVFNGFYSKELYKDIESSLKMDQRAVQNLLKNVDTLYIEEDEVRRFNNNCDMFINLNTQEELNKFIKNREFHSKNVR